MLHHIVIFASIFGRVFAGRFLRCHPFDDFKVWKLLVDNSKRGKYYYYFGVEKRGFILMVCYTAILSFILYW